MSLVDYQVMYRGWGVLLYVTLCRWSRSWSGAVVQMAADDEVELFEGYQYFPRWMALNVTRRSRVSVAGEAVEQRAISLV